MTTKIIFTLTSARSGTLFLRDVFRRNVRDGVCRHEPFFDWGNPTLFGRVIYDVYAGSLDLLRQLLAKKRRYIERLNASIYLESSHAFLKSGYAAALEFFPDLRLIHLIRDPLKGAKSEAWRIGWRKRLHAPFHFYIGDDRQRHFAWGLTGNEEIFQTFRGQPLTLFQWCLVQWIEIENRAIRFVDGHDLQSRCFTLQCPRDLNDPYRLRQMFDFFGLQTLAPEIRLGRPRNKSIGAKMIISPEDEAQAQVVLQRLPAQYLEIFEREPYRDERWAEWCRAVGRKSGPERLQELRGA